MRQAFRSAAIWLGIALVTTLMYPPGLLLFLVTRLFDRSARIGHWYATRWARALMLLNSRWHFEVNGHERIPRGRPLVVVSNHQGMGDILICFRLDIHFKWIAKRIVFRVPFMGWFMSHADYIPVVRGERGSIEECMRRAHSALQSGVSVIFFPEGTRSKDGNLLPFKPGAFKLAIDTGCDILPMAITGTSDALPKYSWRFSDEHAYMRMLIGEPISTVGLSEANLEALIEHTRDTIMTLKDELEGRQPEPLRASA